MSENAEKKYCEYPDCYEYAVGDSNYCLCHKNAPIIKVERISLWLGDVFVGYARPHGKNTTWTLDLRVELSTKDMKSILKELEDYECGT
jgi:hypothetical protein